MDDAAHALRTILEYDHSSWATDPNRAVAMINLAQIEEQLGRLDTAESLTREALALQERMFGHSHPSVGSSLNNLANLLTKRGQVAEAEHLMRRALAVGERALGEDHPDVAIRLNNLAQILLQSERVAEAEQLLRRSLSVLERRMGPSHPQVDVVRSNLRELEARRQPPSQFAAVLPASPPTDVAAVPTEMRVSISDIADAKLVETYRGTMLFTLSDGRVYLNGLIAVATLDLARATLDHMARQSAEA